MDKGKGQKYFYNIEMHGNICLTMVIQKLFFKAEVFRENSLKFTLKFWFEAMESVTSK